MNDAADRRRLFASGAPPGKTPAGRCMPDPSGVGRQSFDSDSSSSSSSFPSRSKRKAPAAAFYSPLLALCLLTLITYIWRQWNIKSYFASPPPNAFPFLRSWGTAASVSVRVTDSAATAASTATAVSAATAVSKADSTTANFACNGLCGGVSLRRLSDGGGDVSTGAASIPIAPSLAFFSFLFFFAIFLQWLVSKIPVYPPPVSIIWFVFGMAAYGVASIPALLPPQPWETPGAAGFVETPGGYHAPLVGHNILQTAILETRFIDSSIVYYVMMPILLYEATQNINWHKFKKFFAGGLTLAVLGVAVQVGVLGVLFYYTFISKQWKDMAWIAAFLLAATLSSTDPVAVLSVLNAVNASDKLCTMFDGKP